MDYDCQNVASFLFLHPHRHHRHHQNVFVQALKHCQMVPSLLFSMWCHYRLLGQSVSDLATVRWVKMVAATEQQRLKYLQIINALNSASNDNNGQCMPYNCYSLHFNGHFPGWPWLAGTGMSPFWSLLILVL